VVRKRSVDISWLKDEVEKLLERAVERYEEKYRNEEERALSRCVLALYIAATACGKAQEDAISVTGGALPDEGKLIRSVTNVLSAVFGYIPTLLQMDKPGITFDEARLRLMTGACAVTYLFTANILDADYEAVQVAYEVLKARENGRRYIA